MDPRLRTYVLEQGSPWLEDMNGVTLDVDICATGSVSKPHIFSLHHYSLKLNKVEVSFQLALNKAKKY
jgi:hypothetical protein